LHLFAKQMIKFIHRRKMSEATEEYGWMVRTLFTPVQTCPEVYMHLHMSLYSTLL
jgi:hypothetical protein